MQEAESETLLNATWQLVYTDMELAGGDTPDGGRGDSWYLYQTAGGTVFKRWAKG